MISYKCNGTLDYDQLPYVTSFSTARLSFLVFYPTGLGKCLKKRMLEEPTPSQKNITFFSGNVSVHFKTYFLNRSFMIYELFRTSIHTHKTEK